MFFFTGSVLFCMIVSKEYTFLGRECKSTGIGKIEAEVFMSQEEIFIPRSDSCLSSRGLADDV